MSEEARIDALAARLDEHDTRLDRIRTQQIEAFGKRGDAGAVGRLVDDMRDARGEVRDLRQEVITVRQEQAVTRVKLSLIVTFSSLGGGVITSLVTRWLVT